MEMTEWECELLCVNNKHSHGLESRWALQNGVLTHGRARRKCSSLKIEPFPFSFSFHIRLSSKNEAFHF